MLSQHHRMAEVYEAYEVHLRYGLCSCARPRSGSGATFFRRCSHVSVALHANSIATQATSLLLWQDFHLQETEQLSNHSERNLVRCSFAAVNLSGLRICRRRTKKLHALRDNFGALALAAVVARLVLAGPQASFDVHLAALLRRVENWRAHGRWRVSSHALSIAWWGHNSTMATFPVPASSNRACGFPALCFPACFAPRVMRPIALGALSASSLGGALGSC